MITIISPAKNMRQAALEGLACTQPHFLPEADFLVRRLQNISPWQLESLMKINPQIALDAFDHFAHFSAQAPGTAALLAYHGLQYKNIDPSTFTLEDFAFAQDHLRILSGLYGVLRPADGILPYRLEMQCKTSFLEEKSLYTFWGSRLYQNLFSSGQPVLNLASAEYSKAVAPHLTGRDTFITCDFLVHKLGKLRTLATSAKMARGQMVRYIVKNRLDTPEQVQSFSWDGYCFCPHYSTPSHYVFVQELI